MTRLVLRKLFFALFLILGLPSFATADTRDLQAALSSGAQRVALIELYTSEGCSSCPPADHWLSDLREQPGLWKRYVPVAFHVDYWDYIGWEDRFARAEYSDRQQQYAAEGGVDFVYTPGVVLQGHAWHGWRAGNPPVTDAPRVGDLRVSVEKDSAAIRFDASTPTARQLIAHVALLGMELETAVRRGENSGRKLRHDFVALDVVSVPLTHTAWGYAANTPLPENTSDAADLALAVWVSEEGAQTPIQSVGGSLQIK
jgi:hypothetical protein